LIAFSLRDLKNITCDFQGFNLAGTFESWSQGNFALSPIKT
jgi:hypothetical protein